MTTKSHHRDSSASTDEHSDDGDELSLAEFLEAEEDFVDSSPIATPQTAQAPAPLTRKKSSNLFQRTAEFIHKKVEEKKRKQKEQIESYEFLFENVWANSTTFEKFKQHVQKEQSSETIEFVVAVNKLATLCGLVHVKNLLEFLPNRFNSADLAPVATAKKKEIEEIVEKIIATHLTNGASKEINISNEIQEITQHKWRHLKQSNITDMGKWASEVLNLFHQPYLAMMLLLKSDCFSRFKRTESWKNFTKDAKNKEIISLVGTPKNFFYHITLTLDDIHRPYITSKDVRFFEFLHEDLHHWKAIYGRSMTLRKLSQDISLFVSPKNFLSEDATQKYGYFYAVKRVEYYPTSPKILFNILRHEQNLVKIDHFKKETLGVYKPEDDDAYQTYLTDIRSKGQDDYRLRSILLKATQEVLFLKSSVILSHAALQKPGADSFYFIYKSCDADLSKISWKQAPTPELKAAKTLVNLYISIEPLGTARCKLTQVALVSQGDKKIKSSKEHAEPPKLAQLLILGDTQRRWKRTMQLISEYNASNGFADGPNDRMNLADLIQQNNALMEKYKAHQSTSTVITN